MTSVSFARKKRHSDLSMSWPLTCSLETAKLIGCFQQKTADMLCFRNSKSALTRGPSPYHARDFREARRPFQSARSGFNEASVPDRRATQTGRLVTTFACDCGGEVWKVGDPKMEAMVDLFVVGQLHLAGQACRGLEMHLPEKKLGALSRKASDGKYF